MAAAIGDVGAILGAIDLVRVEDGVVVRDVTVACSDAAHGEAVVAAVRALDGVSVDSVSDRTFLMHMGGKIEVHPKVQVKTRDDLSMAYTPGVARVSSAIHEDPAKAWTLTIKGNTVAVVSDGTAVLGLGDIGPHAAMPVMEGKAMLFKELAGVDAFPLCVATTDVEEIVAFVKAASPTFGGINLEDISAPRCFEIERRLTAELDIPVFHDDQHGTAIVVLAALMNGLRVVRKDARDIKVLIVGAGAAGVACAQIVLAHGVRSVVVCDIDGALYAGRPGLDPVRAALATRTNPDDERGRAGDLVAGAVVLIGVSGCVPRPGGPGRCRRGRRSGAAQWRGPPPAPVARPRARVARWPRRFDRSAGSRGRRAQRRLWVSSGSGTPRCVCAPLRNEKASSQRADCSSRSTVIEPTRASIVAGDAPCASRSTTSWTWAANRSDCRSLMTTPSV